MLNYQSLLNINEQYNIIYFKYGIASLPIDSASIDSTSSGGLKTTYRFLHAPTNFYLNLVLVVVACQPISLIIIIYLQNNSTIHLNIKKKTYGT